MQHSPKETAVTLKGTPLAETAPGPCTKNERSTLPKVKVLRMRIQVPQLAMPTTEIVWLCTTCADLVRSPYLCTLYPTATMTTATRDRFFATGPHFHALPFRTSSIYVCCAMENSNWTTSINFSIQTLWTALLLIMHSKFAVLKSCCCLTKQKFPFCLLQTF